MFENLKNFVKENKKLTIIFAIVMLVLLVIIFILLVSGKTGGFNPEDKSDKENGAIGPSPDQPGEILLVRQPLGYHKNYEINIDEKMLERLDVLNDEYSGFVVKNSDEFDTVEGFVKEIGMGNLGYEKSSPSEELTIHYWQDNDNAISHDTNMGSLYLNFNNPISLSGVEFKPRDEGTLASSINSFMKKYLSKDFQYSVNEVIIQENRYRVEFNRLLNGLPLQLETENEYILLTLDGKIQEAFLLLVEFQEYTSIKFPLVASSEFKNNVSRMEYPKNVSFRILDSNVEAQYEPYGFIIFSNPFLQEGSMDISKINLVYLYVNTQQEIIVPVFSLVGQGTLDVEGSNTQSEFRVLASAIASKYVYVHPDSHFESLE